MTKKYEIEMYIDDYRNAHIPNGDWQPTDGAIEEKRQLLEIITQKFKDRHAPIERSVFSALIYWKDDDKDGIEQWGTEVSIALYDDDDECEDTFWHHQGTEESFFVDFAKDNKRNQEDFYAEKP